MSQDKCHEPFARAAASSLRRESSCTPLRFAIICAALLLVTFTLCAGCATVNQQPSMTVVQSRMSGAGSSLPALFVTVHVLLQVHENPDEGIRATEDKARISACQERVVENALRLSQSGVHAVVAEGMYGVGSLDKPLPVDPQQLAQTNKNNAAEILAAHSELAVYGFELKPLNEFGIAVLKQLRSLATRAHEHRKDRSGISKPGNDEEVDRHIQDESTRLLNLWYAGLVPARSFLALQTALAVASARHENQVQLIIGRAHWSDLVYAIDRHHDVRLRLVPYTCE